MALFSDLYAALNGKSSRSNTRSRSGRRARKSRSWSKPSSTSAS